MILSSRKQQILAAGAGQGWGSAPQSHGLSTSLETPLDAGPWEWEGIPSTWMAHRYLCSGAPGAASPALALPSSSNRDPRAALMFHQIWACLGNEREKGVGESGGHRRSTGQVVVMVWGKDRRGGAPCSSALCTHQHRASS